MAVDNQPPDSKQTEGEQPEGEQPEREQPGADRPEPEPGSEEAFLDGFDALAQAVRRARGAPGVEGSLTLSQYGLLQVLSGQPSARVRDLACEAGIAPSTATRILDALERRAIVRRTRSAEDRRGVTVSLTDEGRQALAAQDAWMRGRQRAFHAGLPDSERELAPDLLVRLAALIDELAGGPPGPRSQQLHMGDTAGPQHRPDANL